MRTPIIVGNWKMHHTIQQAQEFIRTLAHVTHHSSKRIFIATPFTAIRGSAEVAKGTNIVIGAQNMHEAESGPFTGEVSAEMIKEAGARFVLLGHSERRHLFHETNELINRKMKRTFVHSQRDRLLPILCIGETLKERESGQIKRVLCLQLEACLKEIDPIEMVLAYEPVWAIGTGQTATPQIAEEAHLICREFLTNLWGQSTAERINILYGGSVTPETAFELFGQPNIDGGLIGGASLDVKKFIQIIGAS